MVGNIPVKVGLIKLGTRMPLTPASKYCHFRLSLFDVPSLDCNYTTRTFVFFVEMIIYSREVETILSKFISSLILSNHNTSFLHNSTDQINSHIDGQPLYYYHSNNEPMFV